MTVFNQGWIGFDGSPVTGRVPTQIVLAPDSQNLSEPQRAGVVHAYKLFCDAVAGSAFPMGFHIQHRVLGDGTQIEMRANLGVHEVRVRTPGGGSLGEYLRGFVIRAIWPTGSDPAYPRNPGLLWRSAAATAWRLRVKHYRPGDQNTTPTYFVDNRRANHRSPRIESDQKYADVYCQFNSRLYKNAVAKLAVPDFGSPVVQHWAPGTSDYYACDDDKIKHLTIPGGGGANTMDEAFDRDDFITVIVGGDEFHAAARLSNNATELKFSTLNLTVPLALQVWHVTATLLNTTPWVSAPSASFDQISSPSTLTSSGGWVHSTRAASSPVFGVTDSRALIAYWIYTPPPPGPPSSICTYVGDLIGSTLSALSAVEDVYTYNRTFSDGETVDLYDDWTCGYSRSVAIANELVVAVVNYYIVNTWGDIYRDSVGAPTTPYREIPGSFGSGTCIVGASTGIVALSEDVKYVVHSDVGTSTSHAGPETIYSVVIAHTILSTYGTSADNLSSTTAPATQALGGQGHPGEFVVLPPRSPVTYSLVDERNEVFVLDEAISKDFFFYDEDEEVSAWVETTVGGTRTKINGVTTGTTTATVTLKITSPAGDADELFGTYSSSNAPLMPSASPGDVNFGSLPTTLYWTYTAPSRAAPVFSPLWQVQGMCPHIAYTTANEAALPTGIIPRLLASFRLQLVKTIRPGGMDGTPVLENVSIFRPFMMEQLIENHWPDGASTLFETIELTAAKLDVTMPGNTMFSDLALPDTSTVQANYYRT